MKQPKVMMKQPKVMMKQPWVLIVAVSPKASDSQSEPFGLAVRRDGLITIIKRKK